MRLTPPAPKQPSFRSQSKPVTLKSTMFALGSARQRPSPSSLGLQPQFGLHLLPLPSAALFPYCFLHPTWQLGCLKISSSLPSPRSSPMHPQTILAHHSEPTDLPRRLHWSPSVVNPSHPSFAGPRASASFDILPYSSFVPPSIWRSFESLLPWTQLDLNWRLFNRSDNSELCSRLSTSRSPPQSPTFFYAIPPASHFGSLSLPSLRGESTSTAALTSISLLTSMTILLNLASIPCNRNRGRFIAPVPHLAAFSPPASARTVASPSPSKNSEPV